MEEQKINVGGAEVKVKDPAPIDARPVYHCDACDKPFPSQLDLDEHLKIDHGS